MESGHNSDEELEALIHSNLVRLGEFMDRQPLDLSMLPIEGLPDPKAALLRFERWLHASHSPGLHLQQALDDQHGLRRFLNVLSVSEPLANAVRQNPELGDLFFDSPFPPELFQDQFFEKECEELVRSSISSSHLLDRMRYLKQRYTLEIAARDLSGEAEPPKIWLWLSELAGRLVKVTAEELWKRFAQENELDGPMPLEIIALGKLGSWEVNYSSDLDLLFVSKDGLDWEIHKKLDRFAAQFVSALGEKMGRGSLFRVDMRLRPFGSMGELTPSKSNFLKYLENYAEAWELMALTRARLLAGDVGLAIEEQRRRFCSQRTWTEASAAELLEMRAKIDAHAQPDDFKRSSGGIRDVEFIAQINQLFLSREHPELEFGPTLDILQRLTALGVISPDQLTILTQNYIFLRQLEHRCQMLGDFQTHTLPKGQHESQMIARCMGAGSAVELQDDLNRVMESTRQIYSLFWGDALSIGTNKLTFGSVVDRWLGTFDIGDALKQSLAGSEESAARVKRLEEAAPKVIEFAASSLPFTEMILSGEVEEFAEAENLRAALSSLPEEEFQTAAAQLHGIHAWGEAARWSLGLLDNLSERLVESQTVVLKEAMRRTGLSEIPGIHVYMLGTYARLEPVITSDVDLLILTQDSSQQKAAEEASQKLIKLTGDMHRRGAPIEIDLRLRPEGSQGLLARTFEGLQRYAVSEMETWERFALGQSRAIIGSEAGSCLLYDAAFGQPLTGHRFQELLDMKSRIENERVKPGQAWRDIKLGKGSLSDIEWLVHIFQMKHPLAAKAGDSASMTACLQSVFGAGLINAAEFEELSEARIMLIRLRHFLALQGDDSALLPENPDRLDRLAHAMNITDGNQLLKVHLEAAARVRQIYEDGIARLTREMK